MKAPCSYFKKCSGCTKLQFPYAKQLHDKDKVVRAALARFVGGREDAPAFAPLVPSPQPLGYRTSTKVCLGQDPFGTRQVGLYERGSKTVVHIPGCPVHHEDVNRIIARLTGEGVPLPAPLYDHQRRAFQPGCLKFLTVRACPATGEAGVVLSHTGIDRSALAAWAARLDTRRLSVYEAQLTPADGDRVLPDTANHLAGPARVRFAIGGRDYQLSPLAFFQANLSLTDAFVAYITQDLRGETLLDLYGGFGAYSFAAAGGFARVHLVDGNPSAIAAAAAVAAATAGADGRVQPLATTVEDFLARRLPKSDVRTVTHAIVNPPRAGLSPAAKNGLTRNLLPALKHLTYVSCDLSTLGRDLAELTRKNGLRVESIQPFDLFPQTDHVETVVKLVY
jgi:23S rRNA (uracil1939-C5)-methyltransferase